MAMYVHLSSHKFIPYINIFVKILLFPLILKTLKMVCQQFEAIFAKSNSWQDSVDDSGSLTSIQQSLFCYVISKNNLKYAQSQNIKHKTEIKNKNETNPFFLHISNFFTTPSPCESERRAKSTLAQKYVSFLSPHNWNAQRVQGLLLRPSSLNINVWFL